MSPLGFRCMEAVLILLFERAPKLFSFSFGTLGMRLRYGEFLSIGSLARGDGGELDWRNMIPLPFRGLRSGLVGCNIRTEHWEAQLLLAGLLSTYLIANLVIKSLSAFNPYSPYGGSQEVD